MSRIRVLIVDDSVVFRSQIRAALEQSPGIEVVGAANNGKIAIQKLEQLSVDLITLDMDMPEMDGMETIKEIKRRGFLVRIIIFSSRTQKGSDAAIKALSLGADDFVPKIESTSGLDLNPANAIARDLIPKVLQFHGVRGISPLENNGTSDLRAKNYQRKSLKNFMPSAIVIGSSTGGPSALEIVLNALEGPIGIPIFIVQHMPPVFTMSLASRIKNNSGIDCAEGQDMEIVVPNKIYVAPGDFHMNVIRNGEKIRLSLNKNPQRNSVRPAVDYLFESAATVYRDDLMSFVLTGMGEDGLQGGRAIKESGGGLVIQSRESCVVFGMPGAIFQHDLQDAILDLKGINEMIKSMSHHQKRSG